MAHDFYIKQNDLLPEIEVTCIKEDDKSVVDLTAATAVNFNMRKPGKADPPKVNAAGSFVDKANGIVKYTWLSGDTDTVGSWDAEFEVTIGGKTLTFPNHEQIRVKIRGDVA